MGAKLVAEEGVLKGLVLSLDNREEWIIGRDPEASQLLIEDPSASRKHLLCRTTPQGIVLENLSETNPAKVNDQVLTSPRLLRNGDSVTIGTGQYRFYTDSTAHLFEDQDPQDPPDEQDSSSSVFPDEQEPEEHEKSHITPETKDKDTELMPNLTDEETDSRQDSIFEDESDNQKNIFPEINFDLTDTGRWLLKVISGPNNGAEFSMQASSSYVIGTDPNICDIVFHDNSVSRQHARVSVSEDEILSIEDLRSRNGTLVDGEPLNSKLTLNPNTIVTLGTTSFIIYDREGEMQTIISPLMPSIVKMLQQKEEAKLAEEKATAQAPTSTAETIPQQPLAPSPEPEVKHNPQALGAFIVIAIIIGLFALIGIGTTTLLSDKPVTTKQDVNVEEVLKQTLSAYPDIKYSYNTNGRLLLVGHVLTAAERNRMLYSLQTMNFIRSIDDSGVIIDEGVWREINQILNNNPNWAGITVTAPSPGHFVLTGNLQTRQQAQLLWDYLSTNFPYLDLLEKKVIVEEDVVTEIQNAMQKNGFNQIIVQINNGEVTLTGSVPLGKIEEYNAIVQEIREKTGIRSLRNLVAENAPEEAMINISDRYEVTGVSNQGGVNTGVVINGRILIKGDALDGMTITDIKPNVIFLERGPTQYRIDYSR